MEKLFEVVFENEFFLVINKPAGLVCHPTKGDQYSSLISRTRLYADGKYIPAIVNRLDRETSGIVVVAKSSEVAGELGKMWEARNVRKEYLAIVHGHLAAEQGIVNGPLGKDEKSPVVVKDCVRPDGALAETHYVVQQRFNNQFGAFSLVRVVPLSGRKHQIRIHLQSIGHSIVGDKLYGHDEDCYLALVEDRLTAEQWRRLILPQQALHAILVRFVFRGEEMQFSAPPEAWFREFVV